MHMLGRILGSLQNRGIAGFLKHASGHVLNLMVKSNRHAGHPSIGELAEKLEIISCDVSQILSLLDVTSDIADEISGYEREFDHLENRLSEVYQSSELVAPVNWGLERKSSLLMYITCRLKKPIAVCETGVANGHSTYFLCNAIKKNGLGHVYSIDVNSNVGSLLSDSEREHWDLNVLARPYKASIETIFKGLPELDIFIHDSDHTYFWMMHELGLGYGKLKPGGLLMCDDVDLSNGFLDFCDKSSIKASVLIENRKFFGAAIKAVS